MAVYGTCGFPVILCPGGCGAKIGANETMSSREYKSIFRISIRRVCLRCTQETSIESVRRSYKHVRYTSLSARSTACFKYLSRGIFILIVYFKNFYPNTITVFRTLFYYSLVPISCELRVTTTVNESILSISSFFFPFLPFSLSTN